MTVETNLLGCIKASVTDAGVSLVRRERIAHHDRPDETKEHYIYLSRAEIRTLAKLIEAVQ